MNRLLAENLTTGKYELVTSTGGALNTTGGGADVDGNSIIKGVTDLADPTNTITNVVVSATGEITVKNKILNTTALGELKVFQTGWTNANTPATYTNSRLGTILTTQVDGSQKTQIIGNSLLDGTGTDTEVLVDVGGSLKVKQDDHASVIVQGVSDQSDPFTTKKPLLINTEGKLLVNSQLKGNDGDDGAGTNRTIQCDATGKLEVVSIPNISRGQIGGFTDGVGTGWNANGLSNAIDMTYHKTIEFHIQSSATGSHNIQILVSNDNVTYVSHQQFALQTVGTDEIFKGSLTAGFRYVKLKNVGSDISTTTYKQYALYN